jgi:voltage-gated potassium channel Kch
MRLLLAGSTGLAAVLIGDWAWLAGVAGRSPAEAFEEAARVVATVGPVAEHMGSAYGVWAGIAMLSTIVFTAMATAGLVDRLFEPRLVGMFGRRRAPRSGHVVVVGMGQVGLRLCAELRAMNIPVVGVERNPEAPHLRLAYSLQIPVLLGFGADRGILERAGLPRARALAAVCSDDLDNVAVAVAAAAVAPRVPVVLRAGEQEAVVETRALLPLGVTRDVTQMAATYVVATVSSSRVERVIADTFELHLLDRTGAIRRAEVGESYECGHA